MEIASFAQTLEYYAKSLPSCTKDAADVVLDGLPMNYMTEEEIFDIFFK